MRRPTPWPYPVLRGVGLVADVVGRTVTPHPRLRLRRHLQELERARDAITTAKAAREDPWRVAELQLRYDRLNERVLAAEFEPDASLGPAPHGPAPVFPLAPPTRRSRGDG